jgi:hypothetical protein
VKYQNASPEHTIGAELGNRYAARTRRASSSRRSGAATPAEPSRKPRDAAELLAKIDALYQELTLQPIAEPRKISAAQQSHATRSMGLTFIGILVVVLTAGEVWLYVDRDGVAKRPAAPESSVTTTSDSESGHAVAQVQPAPAPVVIAAPVVEPPPPPAEMFENVTKVRMAAQRKFERKRKAEQAAARLAAEAGERARAEAARNAQLLAAAQAAQAARPRGPTSPEELCAGSGSFFSRNSCEIRACAQPEWANHPSCARRKQELDRLMSGGGG